jgi:hypothetical protein
LFVFEKKGLAEAVKIWHQYSYCGHSLVVKFQPSKLAMRVRFPLPAIGGS